MNLKKAFSIAETVILLTILAIGIAASTPIITRKIANIQDSGSTVGGGTHGRYEIFTKEIVSFDSNNDNLNKTPSSNAYEKVSDPKNSSITVYEKKDDAFIKKITGSNAEPVTSSDGKKKTTIYEEFANATPVTNKNGDVIGAKIKLNGTNTQIEFGNQYIFEQNNIKYNKGELNNNKYRIIEGNFTEKMSQKNPNTNNSLWIIRATASNNPNFKGKVTPIPWERLYSGNNLISEKDVDIINGKPTAIFTPPQNAKNITIHAVGGGGAGGGPDNTGNKAIDTYKSPKNIVGDKCSTTTDKETQIMCKTLERRFKDVAKKKGQNHIEALSIDKIIGITTNNDIAKNGWGEAYPFIYLNKNNGTISAKFDIRTGLVFPHEILEYTKKLGSQTQNSTVYNMPEWLNWTDIQYIANTLGYKPAAVGCGSTGSAGTAIDWVTGIDGNVDGYLNDDDFMCMREKYIHKPTDTICSSGLIISENVNTYPCFECTDKRMCSTTTYDIDYQATNSSGNCSHLQGYTRAVTRNNEYICTKTTSSVKNSPNFCYEGKCKIKCDPQWYTCTGTTAKASTPCNVNTNDYFGTLWTKCPAGNTGGTLSIHRTNNEYTHKYPSCPGGNAPKCAIAVAEVGTSPMDVIQYCETPSCTTKTKCTIRKEPNASAMHKCDGYGIGYEGTSCYMKVGNDESTSWGGWGGMPHIQDQFSTEISLDPNYKGPYKTVEEYLEKATSELNKGLEYTGGAQLANWYKSGINAGYSNTANDIANIREEITKESENGVITYTGTGNPKENVATSHFKKNLRIRNTISNSFKSKNIQLTSSWMCTALPTYTGPMNCNTKNGWVEGTTYNPSTAPKGVIQATGKYNYIYVWTAPYSTNHLAYGESGETGEYKSTKISKAEGQIKITLGQGGIWIDTNWSQGKNGPNGTETTIDMGKNNDFKRILTAKGGKGGQGSLNTKRYDLCYALGDKSLSDANELKQHTKCIKSDNNSDNTICCNGEEVQKTSKSILATNIKFSNFDKIKAAVQNSSLIGLGLGRGGEGAGTRSNEEDVFGTRKNVNVTSKPNSATIYEETSKGSAGTYKNRILEPSALNFKGGDGAVIITW